MNQMTSPLAIAARTENEQRTYDPFVAREDYWGALTDAVQLQPWYQGVERFLEPDYTNDPYYNPFRDSDLTGYEDYASEFYGAGSQLETETIMGRIDRNLERRRNIEQLGLTSVLLSEFANPVNYIPLPGLAAANAAKGAAKGAKLFTGAIAAEEAVRQGLDPTATAEESISAVAMAGVIGGVLGGAVGAWTGRQNAADKLNLVAAEYEAEMDTSALGRVAGDSFEEAQPRFTGAGTFEAKPSQVETVGVASALGLEKLTLQATVWGRAHLSGIRSLGDFADALLGDFGLLQNKNKVGVATQQSVTLAAGKWRGAAGDVVRDLEQVYTKYLAQGGEGGARVADISPAVLGAKVQRVAGQTPSGRMSDKDFMEAVFRAHRSDRIETDDEFVKEGVAVVRKFFDRARDEGLETGLLRSSEGWKKKVEAQFRRAKAFQERVDELKAKDELTTNEQLHLMKLEEAQDHILNKMQRQLLTRLDPEEDGLEGFWREWESREAEIRAGWREKAKSIRDQGKARRVGSKDSLEYLEKEIEKTRQLVAYFDRLEVERGLTDKQRRYRDDLQDMLDQYDGLAKDDGIEGSGAAVPAQLTQGDVTEPLDWLVSNAETPGHRELARFLSDQLSGTNTKMKFVDDMRDLPTKWQNLTGARNLGAYVMTGGNFSPTLYLNRLSGKKEWDEETLLHEALHAMVATKVNRLTKVHLSKAASDADKTALTDGLAQLEALRADVQKQLPKWASATDNVDELVAWGFTNPDFRRALDGVRWTESTSKKISDAQEATGLAGFIDRVLAAIGFAPIFRKEAVRIQVENRTVSALQVLDDQGKVVIDTLAGLPARSATRDGGDGAVLPIDWSDETVFLSGKQKRFLADLEDRLAGKKIIEDADFHPKNEKFYLPRYWLIDKVTEGEQDLKKILFDWFKENPLEGASLTPDRIQARVDKAYDKIVGAAREEDQQVFSPKGMGSSFLNHRGIDIPNELVADFIETDVSVLARVYGQRFGIMNEITRSMGDTSAQDAIDDVLIQSALEVKAPDVETGLANLAEVQRQAELIRDKATGRIYDTSEEAVAARKRAQHIKAYGILSAMGTAVVSSLTEPARAMMIHGFSRSFAGSLEALTNKAEWQALKGELRTATGEGADSVLSTGINRFINDGGPAGAASRSNLGKALQRATDFAYGPYFKLNLLSPFTDLMKNYNSVLGAKFMYEDITGELTDDVIERLASVGLKQSDIAAIRAETAPRKENGVLRFNFDNWSDQGVASRFTAAVAATTRRAIVTPSQADLPEFVRGFIGGREMPLVTLPFQFMSWGMGAVNKIMLSGLQGRDQNALAGAASLFALGWMVEWLKTDDYIFNNMSLQEKATRAFDRSGLVGVFADVPTMVETATLGNVGLRPLLGMDPYVRNPDWFDAAGELGGPAAGKVADMVRLLNGETEPSDITGVIRRSLPLNNILYWKDLFRALEGEVGSALDGDEGVYEVE